MDGWGGSGWFGAYVFMMSSSSADSTASSSSGSTVGGGGAPGQGGGSGGGGNRRTLRTYARREDAEQARGALEDQGIVARVDEHFFRKSTGERVSGGCSLSVPVGDAAEAARVLLKMPPSETAGRPAVPEPVVETVASRNLMRRRTGQRARQKSSLPIIFIAILCSAMGIYWVVRQAVRGKLVPQVVAEEENPDNIFVREDLNWDGEDDSIREYTPGGNMLSMLEDRDFDGLMDVRWIWQRGQLMYRDRDLDRDGTMDERTVFDAYNEPFYVDLRRQGRGPVILRRVYREGVLWKILEDLDADTYFDRIQEFSPDGVIFRDEALPKDSAENGVPKVEALPVGGVRESALPLAPAAVKKAAAAAEQGGGAPGVPESPGSTDGVPRKN